MVGESEVHPETSPLPTLGGSGVYLTGYWGFDRSRTIGRIEVGYGCSVELSRGSHCIVCWHVFVSYAELSHHQNRAKRGSRLIARKVRN